MIRKQFWLFTISLLVVITACNSNQERIDSLDAQVDAISNTIQNMSTPTPDASVQDAISTLQVQANEQISKQEDLIVTIQAQESNLTIMGENMQMEQDAVAATIAAQEQVVQTAQQAASDALATVESLQFSTDETEPALTLLPTLHLALHYTATQNQPDLQSYIIEDVITEDQYEFDLPFDLPIAFVRLGGEVDNVLLYNPSVLPDLVGNGAAVDWQMYTTIGSEQVVIQKGYLMTTTETFPLTDSTSDGLAEMVLDEFDLNQTPVSDIVFIDDSDGTSHYTLVTYIDDGSGVPGGTLYAQCASCQSPNWMYDYSCRRLLAACQRYYR